MANISKQRMQRSVTRLYYLPYETLPTAREFIADVCSKVEQVKGWDLIDIEPIHRYDLPCEPWQVVALYQREMNTLEAKKQRNAEKLKGIREDGRRDNAR